MGSAAAYDMARSPQVETVTLADCDSKLAQRQATRLNKLAGGKKIRSAKIDAANFKAVVKLMRGHAATLSAVPYFFNLGLCKAAIEARCHFADLGGNNVVVRQEYALSRQAKKRGVAIAPDCGLSPGMASILGGELMRQAGGTADSLKIYVGGLPKDPQPPFHYQLVFSVEGLINEYSEPALVLRNGKITKIEPLTEPEDFQIAGFDTLTAFHTSGGTSTLPETFAGSVGECFEKTLRTPSHFAMVRSLYDLGLFSSKKIKIGKSEIAPRELIAKLFVEKFTSDAPDVCLIRIEAHYDNRVVSYTLIDEYDPATKMTAMMRTTAWPAAIVTMMMASGEITKRGGIKQETDVPAQKFLQEMAKRGIRIEHRIA